MPVDGLLSEIFQRPAAGTPAFAERGRSTASLRFLQSTCVIAASVRQAYAVRRSPRACGVRAFAHCCCRAAPPIPPRSHACGSAFCSAPQAIGRARKNGSWRRSAGWHALARYCADACASYLLFPSCCNRCRVPRLNDRHRDHLRISDRQRRWCWARVALILGYVAHDGLAALGHRDILHRHGLFASAAIALQRFHLRQKGSHQPIQCAFGALLLRNIFRFRYCNAFMIAM
jgi:hypothetical protein